MDVMDDYVHTEFDVFSHTNDSHHMQDVIKDLIGKNTDMDQRLLAVENRLFILHANIELEALYPELKEAYNKYKALEEKITTFHTLKISE